MHYSLIMNALPKWCDYYTANFNLLILDRIEKQAQRQKTIHLRYILRCHLHFVSVAKESYGYQRKLVPTLALWHTKSVDKESHEIKGNNKYEEKDS